MFSVMEKEVTLHVSICNKCVRRSHCSSFNVHNVVISCEEFFTQDSVVNPRYDSFLPDVYRLGVLYRDYLKSKDVDGHDYDL